ncbi:DUF5947 family protein [Thermopolyspora sp. NPDC052614]|uniref:DUF5947 family protein n=1 Tax=Thermopolyspora sp. NPDC052614 TaxID=3155682 RepID=UPI00343A62FF
MDAFDDDGGGGAVRRSGLRELILRGRRKGTAKPVGRCELCAAPVAEGHRHLLDREERVPRCACAPCAVLFDRSPGQGNRYVLIPDRRWRLRDFELDDAVWASLAVPVSVLFAYRDSAEGRVMARYPSPAGAVEAAMEPDVWASLEQVNPVLRHLAADVEALLVDRRGAARDAWLVPIDDCHRLVALLRTRWKGLAGGPQVWSALSGFFAELRGRAGDVPARPLRGAPA